MNTEAAATREEKYGGHPGKRKKEKRTQNELKKKSRRPLFLSHLTALTTSLSITLSLSPSKNDTGLEEAQQATRERTPEEAKEIANK